MTKPILNKPGLVIETVPIAALQDNALNPRQHAPRQLKAFARSIRNFGFVAPVLIDKDNVLICGHSMHERHLMTYNTKTSQMDPVLYSFRRCPYAMRARLAIAVSGTGCVLREVKLTAKPETMLAASPKGTLPVLVLPDGKVIDESLDIMRWALAKWDPECWLEGDDPGLIDRNDGPFKHDLDRYKYPERYGVDPLKHRAMGTEFLRELDGRLGRTSQLCGPVRSLADAAIMPFVRQFAAVDQKWFSDQPLLRLKVWLADHISSELFNMTMLRVAPWSPGDRPVRLTRASVC